MPLSLRRDDDSLSGYSVAFLEMVDVLKHSNEKDALNVEKEGKFLDRLSLTEQ